MKPDIWDILLYLGIGAFIGAFLMSLGMEILS